MADEVKLTKLAECAGCGAKVGAGQLAKLFEGFEAPRDPNLLVGFDHSDDAAVYRLRDDLAIVQTVDFFPPMVDDPYVFGQVAAANALSDVYAMGGTPITALNVMAVPESMPADTVRQILRGGFEKVVEAGASLAGGHSIYDDEPKYGMAVTGVLDPAKILRNDGARVGDALVYTKPLGIGIASTAVKGEVASRELEEAAIATMTTLNRAASEVMLRYRTHACTDITGFAAATFLRGMGFVSSVHGAGNFLTCDLEQNLSASFRMMLLLGETNYLQVSQLRRGLESETARLAANRILPGQAAQLMELAVKMRDETDAAKASLYDQEFHNLLCEASGNKLIRSVFGAIRATVNDFIGTVYVRIMDDKEQAVLLHDAHIQLATALTNHDEMGAIRATFTHFEIVNASIQKYELAGRKIL